MEVNREDNRLSMTADDFCTMFQCHPCELNEEVLCELNRANLSYRWVTAEEREGYVLHVLKKISSLTIARSRQENLDAFEKGWRENLALLRKNGPTLANLKPRYFQRLPFLRYRGDIIGGINSDLEYDTFTLARMILFRKYLSDFERIYELGSGSGQNLFMLANMFPDKMLYGLDWTLASADIALYLSKSLRRHIEGVVFDMMEPPAEKIIAPGSAVITIHALEQIGEKHEPLLRYLLASQPGLVLHYEPVLEFYREDNMLDFLALMYCRQRNYLTGFLTALRCLEEEGRIEILGAWRPFLGGVIHEASLIIWKPVDKKIQRGNT
jgi:hypothetical protein